MAQYQILERAMIKGDCAYQFQNVKDVFSNALESGFETGAALTIEHKGEIVVNLWGGYQDKKKTKEWKENTLVNVWSVTKGVTATCITSCLLSGNIKNRSSYGSLCFAPLNPPVKSVKKEGIFFGLHLRQSSHNILNSSCCLFNSSLIALYNSGSVLDKLSSKKLLY